jgi:hypothetical protein
MRIIIEERNILGVKQELEQYKNAMKKVFNQ